MTHAAPPPGSASSAAIGERVFQAQVSTIAANYRGSFSLSVVLSVCYAVLYAWLMGDRWVWGWLALRIFSLAFFAVLITLPYTTPEECRRWLRLFLVALIYHGLVWGLVPWLFMPEGDFLHNLLTALLLVMLCAAGLPDMAPRWSTMLAFALPILLNLIAALLWRADSAREYFLALVTGLYLLMILRTGRAHYRLLAHSLTTRFENQALTEQLAAQMRLVQLASDEKTRFLATASHDLRQPMHAISLFGAVLAKDLAGHPQHANALQLMRAADALNSSLGVLLDTSRLDAGVIAPTIAPVPLNPIFQTLNQIFIASAGERGLQLRVRATPLWVSTDSELLRRMLGNLIENALKYTPRGGVLVAARSRGQQVWIDIADTGIGIAPEHHDQIYAEFFQVSNPGRDRSRGLGMGLSIVKRLSRLLDHPVELHSRPGRGSRFRVVLPAAPPQSAPRPGDAAAAAPRLARGARILLLDDERDIALAMQALLGAHGIVMEHAATPQQARELLATRAPFDALICDLRLADGASGLDFALSLPGAGRAAPPVLIITGETAPDPLQRVHQAGLPVLFKPVTAPALFEALAKLSVNANSKP